MSILYKQNKVVLSTMKSNLITSLVCSILMIQYTTSLSQHSNVQAPESTGESNTSGNSPILSYAVPFTTDNLKEPRIFKAEQPNPQPEEVLKRRTLNSFDSPQYLDSKVSSSNTFKFPESPDSSYQIPTSPPGSYAAPPASNFYSLPPTSSYPVPPQNSKQNSYSPPPSNTYDVVMPPSHSYESLSPQGPDSYSSPVASSTYQVTVSHPNKKMQKFKIIPVLVLFGFFMIGITWVFLRVGFFKQIGVGGNFRSFFDNWTDQILQPGFDWRSETLVETALNAIVSSSSKYAQEDSSRTEKQSKSKSSKIK